MKLTGWILKEPKSDDDSSYVQATQEIEDTHVTLTPVNPDGQQQSSSVSSGFVSNMLNPNQDTGEVDVAVQLKYERIREESNTENQQFLDLIDEGMKKVIKEQVKKEEANMSHAVAANLSELELKMILIDKMEANNSINRSDIQRQLYKALVDAYEADKILLDILMVILNYYKTSMDGADHVCFSESRGKGYGVFLRSPEVTIWGGVGGVGAWFWAGGCGGGWGVLIALFLWSEVDGELGVEWAALGMCCGWGFIWCVASMWGGGRIAVIVSVNGVRVAGREKIVGLGWRWASEDLGRGGERFRYLVIAVWLADWGDGRGDDRDDCCFDLVLLRVRAGRLGRGLRGVLLKVAYGGWGGKRMALGELIGEDCGAAKGSYLDDSDLLKKLRDLQSSKRFQ
ncbi:hypothetical protein Tco_1215651 [Tanacetum coccineum]